MQLETLFLAVSIIDRFLSRGYFKSVRCLQLLGIASITLATRIEENQPYNWSEIWTISFFLMSKSCVLCINQICFFEEFTDFKIVNAQHIANKI